MTPIPEVDRPKTQPEEPRATATANVPTDRTSLEHELERLHAQSFAWALVCCGQHREDAEDALQTAYLRVLDGRARFEGRSAFRTWLFGVIRRVAGEQRRRWWRIALGKERRDPDCVDPTPGPDDRMELDERGARLLAALRALPGRQQEVLELVFYHGMTIAEAGQVIGVSLGSARTHYERGKKNLSRRLDRELDG